MVDQRVAYPRSAQGGSKPDRVLITPRAPLTWVEPASSLNAFLTKTVPESFRGKIAGTSSRLSETVVAEAAGTEPLSS